MFNKHFCNGPSVCSLNPEFCREPCKHVTWLHVWNKHVIFLCMPWCTKTGGTRWNSCWFLDKMWFAIKFYLPQCPCHLTEQCIRKRLINAKKLGNCFRASGGHFGGWRPIWALEILSLCKSFGSGELRRTGVGQRGKKVGYQPDSRGRDRELPKILSSIFSPAILRRAGGRDLAGPAVMWWTVELHDVYIQLTPTQSPTSVPWKQGVVEMGVAVRGKEPGEGDERKRG
jgi:hypothetical protein